MRIENSGIFRHIDLHDCSKRASGLLQALQILRKYRLPMSAQLTRILIVVWLAFFSLPSAAIACLPEFTALDIFEIYDGNQSRTFSHFLKSKKVDGIFTTRATLVGLFSGNTLELKVRYDIDELAIPYNVYAVLVATADEVLSWQDLTMNCVSPGRSVFPGQQLSLRTVKELTDHRRTIHVIVWGR